MTFCSGPAGHAPVVNGAEHAWVVHDPRFPINPELATCPKNLPKNEYSGEFLLGEMRSHNVDHVVISHVCYYGRDNRYPSYCVKTWPGKFAAIGLLVGFRLHSRLHEMCEFLEYDGGDFRMMPSNGGPDDLTTLWKNSRRKRALPARAHGQARAQIREPKELKWPGGKAGRG